MTMRISNYFEIVSDFYVSEGVPSVDRMVEGSKQFDEVTGLSTKTALNLSSKIASLRSLTFTTTCIVFRCFVRQGFHCTVKRM